MTEGDFPIFEEPVNVAEAAVKNLLVALGLSPDVDPHLLDTPKRIAKFYKAWLAQGEEHFRFTTFPTTDEDRDSLVFTGDIRFYSMCSHHFVPFFGVAHIGYLPTDRLAGLSKLARALQMFAHRPQVQERLTSELAGYLMWKLSARGVGVVIKAEHLCMSMRGANVPGHQTVTQALLGEMGRLPWRDHFFNSIKIIGGKDGR
jgi:GTP cyclohydrolase I